MKKYVVLGNENDWLDIMMSDFKNRYNAKILNNKVPYHQSGFIYFLMNIHFIKKINLPFKSIWYCRICKYICDDKDAELVVLIYDWNRFANNEKFLKYLKKHFKNIKLVYMFTNIVKKSYAYENNFVEKLPYYYDLIYTYDINDSKKYNYCYHPLIYSKINIKQKNDKKVFFIGKAKDRYGKIKEVYEFLHKNKINTEFYVSELNNDNEYKDGIIYNKKMPYIECIKKMSTCNCILDIIQGESSGFTLKVCEAVIYDKFLITNNKEVFNAPFYDKNSIIVIDNVEDIKLSFFKNEKVVKYDKNAKYVFSIDHFLEELEGNLRMK